MDALPGVFMRPEEPPAMPLDDVRPSASASADEDVGAEDVALAPSPFLGAAASQEAITQLPTGVPMSESTSHPLVGSDVGEQTSMAAPTTTSGMTPMLDEAMFTGTPACSSDVIDPPIPELGISAGEKGVAPILDASLFAAAAPPESPLIPSGSDFIEAPSADADERLGITGIAAPAASGDAAMDAFGASSGGGHSLTTTAFDAPSGCVLSSTGDGVAAVASDTLLNCPTYWKSMFATLAYSSKACPKISCMSSTLDQL